MATADLIVGSDQYAGRRFVTNIAGLRRRLGYFTEVPHVRYWRSCHGRLGVGVARRPRTDDNIVKQESSQEVLVGDIRQAIRALSAIDMSRD